MANLLRAITRDGAILATAMDSTRLAARAERIHRSSATVTAAIGRMLTAASMMGSMLKNEGDSLTLRIAGGGPCGPITAVSDSRGNARVTVANPIVELPLNDKGKLDVAGAIGREGFLSVARELGGSEPQSGYSPIVSGEIGDDVTYYFAQSEQVPTVCALGVLVRPDLSVWAAGGLLLQLLPGSDEETIARLEENVAALPPVSSMIRDGDSPERMLRRALAGFEMEIIEEFEAEYRCACSKERIERALLSLGNEELLRLADEQEVTSAECHFCENKYDFASGDLRKLAGEALQKSRLNDNKP